MNDAISLTSEEKRFFDSLREHGHAPIFNYNSSDMLSPGWLADVKRFERERQGQRFWTVATRPDWLDEFVEQCFRGVPFYRAQGRAPRTFEAISPIGREVLADEPWRLVPDHLSLEALTVYTTSGTTGTSLAIPTHPTVSSMLLVLLEDLLQSRGIALPRGPGNVAIALVACQRETLTYAALSHYLDGAGFLKLNLAEHAWRDAADRARFLLEADPAVITGSPYAFEMLAKMVPDLRPRAMVSSAVAIHPGHAARLQEIFGCPVFDLYSMTEARAIAGRGAVEESDFALLSPDLYVEILGPSDEMLSEDEVGEVVITGGRNPYLPLLRYRTGDRAALIHRDGRPYLSRFEGREAVRLENRDGETVPSLDVVHALKRFPLVGFSLIQSTNGSLALEYCGEVDKAEVGSAVENLFGRAVTVTRRLDWEGKPHRFGSA